MSKNLHATNASMLGYFYQVRYALYLMLKALDERGSNKTSVKIEGLDDIDLLQEENIKEILQTKYLQNNRLLTDSSKHFWNTIRIWSDHIFESRVEPEKVIFSFVINAKPQSNTIIDLLSND